MAEKPKSYRDNFISKIVKDPQQVPDTIMLSGYLGQSSENNHTRLYFDPQLNNYVEIPDDAILHSQDFPADSSPLGGTYVWIKKDAILIHSKKGPDKVKAKFLDGPIVKNYMKAAVGPGGGGDGGDGGDGGIDNTVAFCDPTFTDYDCNYTNTPICNIGYYTQSNCPTMVYPCSPPTQFCHTTNPKQCSITRTPACHVAYTVAANCQVLKRQDAPNQAQPMGLTIQGHNCPTIVGCHTQVGLCITHTPACHITHTPVCYHTILCHTVTPACHYNTINCPQATIACPQVTIACPQVTIACPQVTIACPQPTIACGGGYQGYQGY